jgi:hypothetical protein
VHTISAGAGGTEATAWAEMLLRMYLRWAERHRFKTDVVDEQAGEQVDQLLEVRGALLERAPQANLVAQALRLADDLLRGALVVPEAGFDGAGVKLRDATFLGG